MKDILNKTVDIAVKSFEAEYAEVRAQNLFKTMLTLKEGRVETAKQGIENGVALRVLAKGSWGFASVGALDVETLTNPVSDACTMAKVAGIRLKTPIKLAKAKAVEESSGEAAKRPNINTHRRQDKDDIIFEQ